MPDNTARPDNKAEKFHNPYNFVPMLSRGSATCELGDRAPSGHGRYEPELYSGQISVKLTVNTPLLIPDAAKEVEDPKTQHKTFGIRMVDEKPYLPPTSIKGALRSAYEAITNSRMGIFHGHDDRLAYRDGARANSAIYPARVQVDDNTGEKTLRIMSGNSLTGKVARLPRYRQRSRDHDKGEKDAALRFHNSNDLPQHGQAVWVKLGGGKVREIHHIDATGFSPTAENYEIEDYEIEDYEVGSETNEYSKGWVYITGPTISGKKYERVFVESPQDPAPIRISQATESLWRELILDYQREHKKAIEKRRKQKKQPSQYLGGNPGQTAYGPYIYQLDADKLGEGTLLYVELNEPAQAGIDIQETDIKALLPVPISRKLLAQAPSRLVDKSLLPASSLEQLSPADRVFGWVNQNGSGAYKGQLRIAQSICISDDAIKQFEQPIALAILGQPKPQQSGFYLAKDNKGNPISDGVGKAEGYRDAKGLRGRKVYPHQGSLQEDTYKRKGHRQDSQNRSMKAWVKEGSEFRFTIDVMNLSSIELGALLYLLQLPEGYYHRMGYGKPLGFGSVRLEIDKSQTELLSGKDLKARYTSLLEADTMSLDSEGMNQLINNFQAAFAQAYDTEKDFDQMPLIQAFLVGARGFSDDLPVHYPRVTGETEQNFRWFVENERKNGPKLSLRPLWEETGLPILSQNNGNGQRQQRRQGRQHHHRNNRRGNGWRR